VGSTFAEAVAIGFAAFSLAASAVSVLSTAGSLASGGDTWAMGSGFAEAVGIGFAAFSA
jgi:hypothetical protein